MPSPLINQPFAPSSVSTQALGLAPAIQNKTDVNFSQILGQAIQEVNRLQMDAGQATKAYEMGDKSITLPEVMIAGQKASVAFTAVSQVRNHVVQAYKDVMNMPI